MSKVAIKGNTSGTGTFTVEAPNSNTDRTLVLPDEAGTVLTSASSITSSQLPSGSRVLISEDADGATGISAIEISLPTGSTYDHYILKIDDYYFASGGGNDLVSQVAVGGTYQTGSSDYRYMGPATRTGVSINTNGSNGTNRIRWDWYSSGDSSAEPAGLHLQIWNSMDSGSFTRFFGIRTGQSTANETLTVLTGGFRANNEVNDKIKFYGHVGGNLAYASYQLYGVVA